MTPGPFRGAASVVLLALLLLVSIPVALAAGRYAVPLPDLLRAGAALATGASGPSPESVTVLALRVPRVLAATLVGMALASSGAAYQSVFRNPMADPSLLGVSAGAACGAAAAILFGRGALEVQLWAFAGGLVAVSATAALARGLGGGGALGLVLCGIVVGSLATALLSLAKTFADPYAKLPAITAWLLGGLTAVEGPDVRRGLLLLPLSLVPLWLLRGRVDALAYGDDEARSLGVRPGAVRAAVVAGATLATAASVALGGLIGWVGILVPHLARLLVGPSFPRLLPASLLLGGVFLLWTDTLSRTLFPLEIPLGILTAILGAPAFLALLHRSKRAWT